MDEPPSSSAQRRLDPTTESGVGFQLKLWIQDPEVIAELKQERADRTSPFVRIMRERVFPASGMSKYCVGLLLLGKRVKHNAFKAVLLKLDRIRQAA